MPDTGAPWNIPYVESTDLVSDWPTDSLALANAIDAGLDVANSSGGVVDVKSSLKTNTFTASLASGATTDITGISITHTLADASNTLIIMAFCGAAGNSSEFGNTGIAVADGGTLIGVGSASGSRSQVLSGGYTFDGGGGVASDPFIVSKLSGQFEYAPGDTASHTYTLRAVNMDSGTETVYINRSQGDNNDARSPRSASGLVIMEVSV